jgi:HAD superfamily hydrolase (TIGR01509 family)
LNPHPQIGRTIDAVVFDMDGTLFDSSTVVPDAYIALVRSLGGPTLTREQVVEAYAVGPPAVLLAHLLGRASSADELAAYHTGLAAGARGVRVYAGMSEALAALGRAVPLAVFTGADARAADVLLRESGLSRHFAAVVGGDQVALPKPAPHGILLACQRLGITVERAAYVGDAPNDLEAARRSGALAVGAGWGHQFHDDLDADLVLASPRDLLVLVT